MVTEAKDQPYIVILMGPPGGGKGTQAKMLVQEFGLIHYSTGDILREEARRGTPAGLQARAYMEAGELVPDEILGGIVRERLAALRPGQGCILDGYPRSLAQARFLEEIRGDMPCTVINIEVPEEVLVRRLAGRRTCPTCGKVYNVHFSPPRVAERCDDCGSQLQRRKDDQAEVVRERLRVYRETTRPVVDFYRGLPGYHEVDGSGDAAQVFEAVSRAVGILAS